MRIALTDKIDTLGRNVVDFLLYQQLRNGRAGAMSARACLHCGAALADGESETDCSTLDAALPRRLRAD